MSSYDDYYAHCMQRTDSGYASLTSPGYSGGYDSGYTYKDEPSFSPIEAEYYSTREAPAFACLFPACSVKPFKRSADLGRHVQHVHGDKAAKKSFSCDYPRCQRQGTEPFYRKDHFRDHLRDYHKEDLGKRSIKSSSPRGSSSKQDELGLAGSNISPTWWRCSRCLMRNDVPYWECADEKCGTACERDRREARLRLRR